MASDLLGVVSRPGLQPPPSRGCAASHLPLNRASRWGRIWDSAPLNLPRILPKPVQLVHALVEESDDAHGAVGQ